MAESTSGAKFDSDKFEYTERIMSIGFRIHAGKQNQRCDP